ncbi:MAG TPA: OmpH family outer membrane protein [Candidatus Tumulicola sp.]|nr:OmpH family outer membrane protein [Candidatus Tumulicola sp.]
MNNTLFHSALRAKLASMLLVLLVAVMLGGCAHAHSKVAVVNVTSIEQHWPKFINYANQLQANYNSIITAKMSPSERQRQILQFQQQEHRWQNEVTDEVRGVVKDIAAQRHYELVVTRQGVAYGGDDITDDVEKALKITPVSPSPGK